MPDIKDFPFPLDTDIVEQVPVKKVGVDIDENGKVNVKVKTVMEKQTVRYMHVPKVRVRCPIGQHFWRVYVMRKWLFACTKCPFVRRVYPGTYRFIAETGKLINKKTGQEI